MPLDDINFIAYRVLATVVAIAMAIVIVRAKDWREQLYGALVFVPFALRALGIK